MITGLNTDVQHRKLVLHVQTEDKGVTNPCIESLVYVGGQILERRRKGYRKLLDAGEGKSAIARLMENQHRSLIDEIRRGRLDPRLVDLGALEAASAPVAEPMPDPAAVPSPTPAAEPEAAARPPLLEEADAAPPGPTLDQVILEYLNAEAEQDHLVLLMNPKSELRAGQQAVLSFQARTSLANEPVVGAEITVKMISPSSEPVDLGEGETDGAGLLELEVNLPDLDGITAALIVRAESPIGAAEIKHLI